MVAQLSARERAERIKGQENEQGLLTQDGAVIEFKKRGAAAQDPASHEMDLHSMTEGFFSLHEGMQAMETLGIPVPCPLPAYPGLVAYFRVGIKSRYFKERPVFDPSAPLMQERDRALSMKVDENLSDKQVAKYMAAMKTLNEKWDAELQQWRMRETEWLSQFVVRIEPWTYARLAGYDSDNQPVLVPLPPPTALDPEAYHILPTEFEDLYEWLADPKTFQQALEISLGKNG